MDARSGDLRSITSIAPLSPGVINQFDALPGSKTYTQDVHTGGIVAIARS